MNLLSKKNLRGIFLVLVGLMTILSLCFNIISASIEEPYLTMFEQLGVQMAEDGFGALDFDVVFSSVDVLDSVVGVFALFPLLVGIIAIIIAVGSLFIKNESLAGKLQNIFAIVCVAFVGLYMIDGIVSLSTWSDGMYWEGVSRSYLDQGVEYGYVSFSTYTYIPFILIAILFAGYIILPTLIAKKVGGYEGKVVKTTTSTIAKPSANIKSQTERLALLKEYKEALDAGIITQEEFDAKKKELL